VPQLTFAGEPLLFDWQYETGRFQELYQRLDETVLNGLFPHRYTWQTSAISKTTNIGLPIVMWPEAPPLRLNQLYYPVTGATRWAEGVFLCNGETKNKIDTCDNAVNGGILKWETDDNPNTNGDSLLGELAHSISITMFPLAFRRIAGCRESGGYDPNNLLSESNADDFDLYLVHLVDKRYWWQFVDAPEPCEQEGGWTGKINYLLETSLGVSYEWAEEDSPLPSAYDTGPHPSEWSRSNHNAAQLLDAALESVGARLVAQIDSVAESQKYVLQRHAGAEASYLLNMNSVMSEHPRQIAGTDCSHAYTRSLPGWVEVAFPKSQYGMLCAQCYSGNKSEETCHEDYYTILKKIEDVLSRERHCEGGRNDTTKTIFVRGWADMGGCNSTTPINYTELHDLAEQISEDWYKYRTRQYDFTFIDVGWIPNGYDDSMIFKFGVEYEDDLRGVAVSPGDDPQARDAVSEVILQRQYRRDLSCRIQSLPVNVGADTQLHDTNAVELTASTFAQIPSEAFTPSRMFCDTYTPAIGTLCNAYRVKGDAACGPLQAEAVVYRNQANAGQQYKILVFNISDYCTETNQGQPIMVKATECILPGAGGTVQPQRWNSSTKCWEDSSASPVKVIDPMGWLLAVPDDCFKVEPCGTSTSDCDLIEVRPMECCAWRAAACQPGQIQSSSTGANEYMPSFPFGMTQIVRVLEQIDCGQCGEVTIVRKAADTGSESAETGHCGTEATECTFQACNMSYRPIACDGPEYAIAHTIPGQCCLPDISESEERCLAFLMPYPRPMFAKGTLTAKMCGGAPELRDAGPLDVCDAWEGSEITSASNPLGLHACVNTDVLLMWCTNCGGGEEQSQCSWMVIAVEDAELPEYMLDVRCKADEDGDCGLQKKQKVQTYYGHFCECEDDREEWVDTEVVTQRINYVYNIETGAPGEAKTFLTDVECGAGCSLEFARIGATAAPLMLQMRSACVLCADEKDGEDLEGPKVAILSEAPMQNKSLTGAEVDVVTGIAVETEVTSDGGGDEVDCDTALGLSLVVKGKTKKICVFCGGDGEGTFEDGDEVTFPLPLQLVEAVTEADFYCDPCVGMDVKTTQFYALCVGDESPATSVVCDCYECPPESSS
jgi:hypothetical protein